MRIIKEKTLAGYCESSKYNQAEESIKAWVFEVRNSVWDNANELKLKYGNASIISSKRVVFNIKGNDYRLIVDIEYKLKLIFIVWFGTHEEYDKIDAKTVSYEN
ncbi:MAG: type II toxin-antitoxin system HigB family toxin [Bacteroidales bacterium]|nr:type II toxin-antitoxin system HigB family toxin [Bacteroidales bacterium]